MLQQLPFPVLIILNQDLFTPCKLHMCTPPLEPLSIKTAHLAQMLLHRTAVTWKMVAGHMKFYSVCQTSNQFASLHETLKASAKACPNADCNIMTTVHATRCSAQHSATEPTSLLFNMEFGGCSCRDSVILVLRLAVCLADWLLDMTGVVSEI